MHGWILDSKLQCWIRVAQNDNFGKISAIEYCANTVENKPCESTVTFIRKGHKVFSKLKKAYLSVA